MTELCGAVSSDRSYEVIMIILLDFLLAFVVLGIILVIHRSRPSVLCPHCHCVMTQNDEETNLVEGVIHVVPHVQHFVCPQCGYHQRRWPY